jgi:hypothetical protein
VVVIHGEHLAISGLHAAQGASTSLSSEKGVVVIESDPIPAAQPPLTGSVAGLARHTKATTVPGQLEVVATEGVAVAAMGTKAEVTFSRAVRMLLRVTAAGCFPPAI